MTRWRFVIQNNAHRSIGAKVVNVQIRLVRLFPCLGKEQQWVTKVTSIGRVIHCPDEMSGGIDHKIDFHFNCRSRFDECHLVGRYCDSQGIIGTGFTGILVGLGINSRSSSRVGFFIIHCGKCITLVCWLSAIANRESRTHPKYVCRLMFCFDNDVGTLGNLRAW